MPGIRKTAKAILILVSAALALRQVMVMIEEYIAYPTNTLYAIKHVEEVRSPAFTICPKPSLGSAASPDAHKRFSVSSPKKIASKTAEDFKNASVSLFDVLLKSPNGGSPAILDEIVKNISTVNGESTYVFPSGTLTERTFAEYSTTRPSDGFYCKCFSFAPDTFVSTGPATCSQSKFVFTFESINMTPDPKNPPYIEVFIHDQREQYTYDPFFSPARVVLHIGTVTSISIRPEIIQNLSKREDPCTTDEDYSNSRCIENCFWEKFYSDPEVTCLVPSLLTKETKLTKPVCKDLASEETHFYQLLLTKDINATKKCNCPERCNIIDYEVYGDSNPSCRPEDHDYPKAIAALYFGIPSKRVPYILEREKVTLPDLLSNIGGIVGVCLGISIITIFDILDQVASIIRRKLFPRRNEVIDVEKS